MGHIETVRFRESFKKELKYYIFYLDEFNHGKKVYAKSMRGLSIILLLNAKLFIYLLYLSLTFLIS